MLADTRSVRGLFNDGSNRSPKQRKMVAGSSLIVGLTTITACSAPMACSAIGAQDGVEVTVSSGLLSPSEVVKVTACVDTTCQSQTYNQATPLIFVPISPVQAGEVTVSVSFTAGERVIFDGKTATRTIKYEPNGPGCAPTVWLAKVNARSPNQLIG